MSNARVKSRKVIGHSVQNNLYPYIPLSNPKTVLNKTANLYVLLHGFEISQSEGRK